MAVKAGHGDADGKRQREIERRQRVRVRERERHTQQETDINGQLRVRDRQLTEMNTERQRRPSEDIEEKDIQLIATRRPEARCLSL